MLSADHTEQGKLRLIREIRVIRGCVLQTAKMLPILEERTGMPDRNYFAAGLGRTTWIGLIASASRLGSGGNLACGSA